MTNVAFTVIASLVAILFSYGVRRYSTLIRYNLSLIIYPLKQPDRHQSDLASTASAFENYSRLAHSELYRMQHSYATINRQHKRIGFDLGYPRKLVQLQETIEVNSFVAKEIAGLGQDARGSSWNPGPSAANESQQLGRMREVLKHFVRDWSEEGAGERLETFTPILDELSKTSIQGRGSKLVLVPGAGLGRLSWEIALLGFSTTSNEVSPYMNLAFRFLVTRSATSRCHQHVIHPFAYWFSHQRSNASLFRTVTFPDVLPSLDPMSRLQHHESDFLNLVPVEGGYDYIVTHYFIDTSRNIISTLQKIHSLLKTGGTWINLGPLLWMSGGQAALELSLEEVLSLSASIGLNVVDGSRRTIHSEYTRDNEAMMRWIYEAEFWVALKD